MKRLTKRFERVVCYIGKNKQNDEDTAAEMSVPAIRDVLGKLAEYEDTGLEPTIIKYRLDAVNACVNSALRVINEFAPEMEYCIYSRIYQAVAAIGGNEHG